MVNTLWFPQAEGLDGGKRWKNEGAEEKAAGPFGSPSRGQAINLLDTVREGRETSLLTW